MKGISSIPSISSVSFLNWKEELHKLMGCKESRNGEADAISRRCRYYVKVLLYCMNEIRNDLPLSLQSRILEWFLSLSFLTPTTFSISSGFTLSSNVCPDKCRSEDHSAEEAQRRYVPVEETKTQNVMKKYYDFTRNLCQRRQ